MQHPIRDTVFIAFAILLGTPALAQRILIVDIDDIGQKLLDSTPTPNIDRLAVAGLTLENFYTAPVCAPTRQRMNLGVYGNHPDVLLGSWNIGGYSMPLAPLEPLAAVVSNAGFTTAKIGKWHLAPQKNVLHPNRAGWQSYAGVLNNPKAGGYYDYDKVTDGVTTHSSGLYLTTDETDDAIAVVQTGVNLVSVSYHAAHAPFHLPPPGLYSGPPPNSDEAKRGAALQALDAELGRLAGAALSAGYTLLVFSDNGSALTDEKGQVWERGVNMPCFVVGRGIPIGSEDALVGVEDLYATVLDLFGIPGAGSPTRGAHSISFAPLLLGATHTAPRRWNYAERWNPNGANPRVDTLNTPWVRGIRSDRYKLVREQGAPGEGFYDLWVDADEQDDLLQRGLRPELREVYGALARILDGM